MLSSVPWKASQTRRNELSFLVFKSTAARLQPSIILRKLLLLMATRKEFKLRSKENELLLMQLPYYNCKDLVTAHTQFNNLIDANLASRKSLDSFASLYDLGVFQLNSANKSINPDVNLITNLVLSNYYSPHSFSEHFLPENRNLVYLFYTLTYGVCRKTLKIFNTMY